MYRDYSDYLASYSEDVKKIPNLRKKSLEEFLWENYRDKVEYYLMEEYCLEPFHEIIYSDVSETDMESEELTESEKKAHDIHDQVGDIIESGFKNKISIQRVARKVFSLFKELGKTKEC